MDIATREGREVVEAAEGVHVAELLAGERASVRYFRIDPGARVPEHSHSEEQVGYVTQGVLTLVVGEAGSVEVDGEPVEAGEHRLDADDAYLIPGGQPHAAANRSDGLVEGVDVFAPPRSGPGWQ